MSVSREVEQALPRPVVLTLAHIDPKALGIAIGLVSGFWVFFATVALLIKGGGIVGPNLYLLSQFFLGYRVTFIGALIGFLYGGLIGFLLGYSFAVLRNYLVHSYLVLVFRRAQQDALNDLP